MYENILMNVDCYSLLRINVRFARLMMCHITKLLHIHMRLYKEYISSTLLNVIKLSKDIYIEVRDWTETDNLQMIIDEKNNFQFGYAIEKSGVGSITKCEMGSIN